jgi:SSS family solute:Na+ symporter
MYILYKSGGLPIFRSDLHESLWSGIVAFTAGAIAILIASRGQAPKPDEELHGLVYGMAIEDTSDTAAYPWYKNPVIMGTVAIVLGLALYIVIALL